MCKNQTEVSFSLLLYFGDIEAFLVNDPLLFQSTFVFLQLDLVVPPDVNLVMV